MNAAILGFLFLASLSAQPQSAPGTIRGTVTSRSTGERIVHAEVSLYPPTFTTYSVSNGVYRLKRIPAGEYSLTISAPGYARMTFRGLLVPQYTPLVLDAKLRDAATSSDSAVVVKVTTSSLGRPVPEDKMMFYQPDSTVDYKIRIANPASPRRGSGSSSIPDSSRKRK